MVMNSSDVDKKRPRFMHTLVHGVLKPSFIMAALIAGAIIAYQAVTHSARAMNWILWRTPGVVIFVDGGRKTCKHFSLSSGAVTCDELTFPLWRVQQIQRVPG